jgi:hypothetical protein
MTELNETVRTEIDDMFSSLEKSKNSIEKQFKNLLEDFISQSWNNFDYYLTTDARYNYESWIRKTCNDIVESLLSGETEWLKDQRIISEYGWEKLRKIRLKIWKEAGGEIANSTIAALLKENEELKRERDRYLKLYSERY